MSSGLVHNAQKLLARAVSIARSIQFDDLELASREDIQSALIPEIQNFLRKSDEAVALVEDLSETPKAFEGYRDPLPSPRVLDDLSDLCFVVRGEISARQKSLGRIKPKTPDWALIVAAERGSVDVIRGLCAVEKELCAIAETSSRTNHIDMLSDSLLSRGVLTKFRRAVSGSRPASTEATIRSAGTALARLIGRDEFRTLRISNRLSARQLHRRAVRFLRDPQLEPDDGRRLLEDVRAFAILLGELNQREELIHHDLEVINEAIDALAPLDQHSPLPGSEIHRLHAVFGRDDVLDQLLVGGAEITTVLTRIVFLRAQLGPESTESRALAAPDSSASLLLSEESS